MLRDSYQKKETDTLDVRIFEEVFGSQNRNQDKDGNSSPTSMKALFAPTWDAPRFAIDGASLISWGARVGDAQAPQLEAAGRQKSNRSQ